MMIRRTQLNALLPAMQFSLAPWDYGKESAELCRRYATLHGEYASRIFALAEESTQTGVPIIRPIFWLDANNENALTCDDEFLVGDDILVAPVLFPHMRRRDIYLPPGIWQDHRTKKSYNGSILLKDYPAPLEILPFFERVRMQ
jgi:myogenesis-regulating glycosidase